MPSGEFSDSPRVDVPARRDGALSDRLNTSKAYAHAASGLTQIQFPNSNFIGTYRSRSAFITEFFQDLMSLKKDLVMMK